MKNLYRMAALLCVAMPFCLTVMYARAGSTAMPDSMLTSQYIYGICISEPERALKLTDEMEKRHLLPQFRLDHLRSLIYQNGLSMYRLALQYSLKAYRSDSIRLNLDRAVPLLTQIADLYNSTGNYTESTRYAVEGIDLARQAGNRNAEAILLLYIGINKRDMGLKDEADQYVEQARQILEEVTAGKCRWKSVDDLIYIYGAKLTYAMCDEKYTEAIALLPRYERLMEKFKTYSDIPRGLYDMRLASGYIAYAYIFLADGKPEKGEEFYRKFEATDYARSDDGKQARFRYLVTARRYREALDYIHADKQRWREQGDTINYYYLERDLNYEAQAYEGLGNHEMAARTYKQMYVLSDSLRTREKQDGVLELATIYETGEKEAQLLRQASQLRESRMMWIFAVCVILLLGVVLWRYVHHSRIISRKNEAMADTIKGLLKYKEELYRSKEENLLLRREIPSAVATPSAAAVEKTDAVEEDNSDSNSDEQQLFYQVEHEIVSRQLFLLPESPREELIKDCHIPKNKFALLFKHYAGMSFSMYMNKLRLEYAAGLLHDHPEYSMDAIAQSSGISSTSTFYRLFSDVYGMTPLEFRKTVELSKKEEDTD